MTLLVKTPATCLETELQEFCKLAAKSGEVQHDGLENLIGQAKALAFLRVDIETVGIAGLKKPRPGYRQRVFAHAKTKYEPNDFPYELGWVYIEPAVRKKGHSLRLVGKLLDYIEGSNVYATSRKSQTFMHRTLERCDFTREGDEWISSQNNDELLLFIRRRRG